MHIRSNNIPENKNLFEVPEPILSKGKNMFVRITPDTTDMNSRVDFQAFATDYKQTADCGKMVMNVNIVDKIVVGRQFLTNPQKECYYILHANDPTNNALLTSYVKSDVDDINKFDIYKGLTLDGNHLLVKNSISTWASDKYLVIHPTETVSLDFGSEFLSSLNVDKAVASGTHGQFMTNDFYQNSYPALSDTLEQTFTLRWSPPMTSIQISYLRIMGAGTLTVNGYRDSKQIYHQVYNPGTTLGPINETLKMDMVQLKYATDMRNLLGGSGFYALYDDATVYTEPPKDVKTTPSSVTSRPVRTTTKSSRSLFYFTVTIILVCLIMIC